MRYSCLPTAPVTRVAYRLLITAIMLGVPFATPFSAGAAPGGPAPNTGDAALPVILIFTGYHPLPGSDLCSLSGQVACPDGVAGLRVELGGIFSGVTLQTNRHGQFNFLGEVLPGDVVTAVVYSRSNAPSDVAQWKSD